jgi:general secretion pathway protein K
VQDETGKVDINFVSDRVLRQLLAFTGLDAPDAAAMTDRILDWRDATPARRLNGAKATEYRAAGLDYAPRNAPFRSVGELRLVIGMTPALYAAMAPLVTVYSQTASIDPTFAPLPVLQMLATFDAGAAAALRRRIASASEMIGPPAGQRVTLGHAFTIVTEFSGPGALHIRRSAVIRLTGQPDAPYWIYRWS